MRLKRKKMFVITTMIVIIIAIVGVAISVGVKKMSDHNKSEAAWMRRVVDSDDIKKECFEEIRNIDPQALNEQGKIKFYKIDYQTLEQNPMGGIMFDIIINDDSDLKLGIIISKNGNEKAYSISSFTLSKNLDELGETK